MNYLTSKSIQIFPISTPRTAFPGDRVLLESNLINFIKGYTDREGFVISTSYSPSKIFEFILHGYYCKLLPQDTPLFPDPPVSQVYACILVQKSGTSSLVGQDEIVGSDYVYKGVQFVSDLSEVKGYTPTSQDLYSLLILQKEGDSYIVPPASLIKFESRSVNIRVINGGTV